MSNSLKSLLALTVFTVFGLGLMQSDSSNTTAARAVDPNPLLSEWSGPFGGVPPFDQVKIEYFKPALEAAMAENLVDIDKIAKEPAAPTFANTIVALEKAGQTLDRVS